MFNMSINSITTLIFEIDNIFERVWYWYYYIYLDFW